MKTYEELRTISEQNSRISARVVDDFLISYAAGHQGLEKKMEQQFDRFSHLVPKLGKEAVSLLKSQYLAHKIFRQEGLLGKFLRHPALGRFKGEDRDYLAQHLKLPWRFCFSVIVDEPAADFYLMEDVFSGKHFLLHSPAVSDIMDATKPILWFNLIGFNGFCWQSYGPVVYYQSFEKDDIYFFATELNPRIGEAGEVMAYLEKDPLPYMMLISGSSYPLTFHKEEQLMFLLAEHDLETLDTAALKKGFTTEYEKGVYRITHKKWGESPHFAQAFFDEEKQLLLFGAMTRGSFEALVKSFNTFGHDFPLEPFLEVNMAMVSTASEVLDKKVVVNEYLDLFQMDGEPETEKVLDDINAFIALVLPDINAGITPDIEEAARKTGVDIETARSVVESVLGSRDRLPGPQGSGRAALGGPVGGSAGSPAGGSAGGKKAAAKKRAAPTLQLPARSAGEVRLLSPDDKLLFGLHLYMMAGDIRREAPWEYLYEDEIFGVQVPGTDLVYFVSVMGYEGEFPALSFYKGYEGLANFLDFRDELEQMSRQDHSSESMSRASTMIGGIMTIPHMMLSFTDREELGKEDLKAIKKSGVPFRGKGNWPRIEKIIPGYMPVYPDKDSLMDLFLVMKQVLVVLEKAEEDEYLISDEERNDCFLIRIPTGKGPKFRWKDHYLLADPDWGRTSYSYITATNDIASLSRLPKARHELQLDLFMLPAPVKEKGQLAYFPFVLLMLDKLSGMIISTAMLTPKPDLRSMYESIPQKVLEELLKYGHRPSVIEIRTDLLFDLLEETLEHAGCRVSLVSQMPTMDEVIGSMISKLS